MSVCPDFEISRSIRTGRIDINLAEVRPGMQSVAEPVYFTIRETRINAGCELSTE